MVNDLSHVCWRVTLGQRGRLLCLYVINKTKNFLCILVITRFPLKMCDETHSRESTIRFKRFYFKLWGTFSFFEMMCKKCWEIEKRIHCEDSCEDLLWGRAILIWHKVFLDSLMTFHFYDQLYHCTVMVINKVGVLIYHCGLGESTMKTSEFSEASNCQRTY